MMSKKTLSILALLCLTVSSSWADPLWLKPGDTWNDATKTLTVNSNLEANDYRNNSEIVNLIIADDVTSIAKGAFFDCIYLTSLTIGRDLTSIGDWAFRGYNNLTTITVDAGNTKFDSRDDCNAIIETVKNTLVVGCKNSTIPSTVTAIGDYAFTECLDLTSVTIGNNVTVIGKGAFEGCYDLTSVTIGNGVTTLDRAFLNCGFIETLTLGNNVTTINDFETCNHLKRLVCMSVMPPTCSSSSLQFVDKTMCKLYVPVGTISSYQTAASWNEFLFVREGIYTSPDESEAILIDAWEGVTGCSEAQLTGSCDYTPTISPLWVDNVDTSWGIPNNSYACFSPINNTQNISVTYHSDEVIAGEHYKLQVFFAPETREEMNQLPCRVDISTSSGENDDMDLVKNYSVSGTEVTVFETDYITFPQNSFDLTILTRVSNAQIRRNDFIRVFRIAKIQLLRETASISSLGQSTSATDYYYAIDGHKIVGKPTKRGLYIKNGKKIWVM